MTEQEKNDFKDQLNRIERCLTGDTKMGHVGLVTSVAEQGRRISAIERAGIYLGGGGAVIGIAWTIWTQWPRR